MSEALKRVIGQRVRDARQEAGLTQENLADRIDRTPESISKLERGVTLPDITTLIEIASATGKGVSTFLDLPEDRLGRSIARRKLEARLWRYVANLSENDLKIAVELIEVIAKKATR